MLTTLEIPFDGIEQYFIYRNSEGTNVRVTLNGNPGDAVELLGTMQDPATGVVSVVDLVGIRNGDFDDIISWPGYPVSEVVNLTTDPPTWVEPSAPSESEPGILGSLTELFAVYVARCSANTVLTISLLGSGALSSDDGRHFENLTPWEGTLPVLFLDGDDAITPPANSGGVIVGAIRDALPDDLARHFATVNPFAHVEEIGLYPGTDVTGPLMPGITIDPENTHMGRIFVGGTVSGAIQFGTVDPDGLSTGGDVEVMYLGFLWGNITVGGNVQSIVLREGGGGVVYGDDDIFRSPGPWSTISVGKSLGFLDSRALENSQFYSAVVVVNDPMQPVGSSFLNELEYGYPADPSDSYLDERWRTGHLVDYANNTPDTAQFLSHPSGNFVITGELEEALDNYTDWYALPLMAGQTVVISGILTGDAVAHLYDATGRWMDSYGYETVEDAGLGSLGSTPKPIRFTAPAAGIYYLNVLGNPYNGYIGWGAYELTITNGPAVALGGVNTAGIYEERRGASTETIRVLYGGGIGGVAVWDYTHNVRVLSDHGGDLVAFQAASIGHTDPDTGYVVGENRLYAGGSIGSVRATGVDGEGLLYADIYAGANGDTIDARICNITAASHFIPGSTLWSSGNIGIIDIGGGLGTDGTRIGNVDIRANTDGWGQAGRIDLILVGGGYYWPSISTGFGGDVGYIHVGGTIFTRHGNIYSPLAPVVVTDGRTTILSDDNGGTLTISPRTVTDPVTGLTTRGSYTYTVISTGGYMGSGTGVLSRLQLSGPVDLLCTGAYSTFQITDLTIALGLLPLPFNMTIGGTGTTNVYSLQTSGVENLTLYGNLISGTMGGNVSSVTVRSVRSRGGSVGEVDDTSTRAWLYGPNAGESWFSGRTTGLTVGGSLGEIRVDGALGDLRVGGALGKVVVNADGITRTREWDGVQGVIYSATRIGEVQVGDGLADDGGIDVPKAGIHTPGSIDKVSITGPRREVGRTLADLNEYLKGPVIFGELNGSIIGASSTLEEVFAPDGVTVIDYIYHPAIDLVEGKNGAVLTALVVAGGLNSFQCFRTGWIGGFTFSGEIVTVSFSGAGGQINATEIAGLYIGTVKTGVETQGIYNTIVRANVAPANQPGIVLVSGGGPGLIGSSFYCNGGSIGTIRGNGSVADIIGCEIVAGDGTALITARDIVYTEVHMPGTLATVTTTRNLDSSWFGTEDNPIGAVTRMTIGGSILDNEIHIARLARTITVAGDFVDSVLNVKGGNEGVLQSLTVNGNISGRITCSGRIGSIISRNGVISAYIATLADGWSARTGRWDIALIQTAGGFTGYLSAAGSLLRFISSVSLGENPEDVPSGQSQILDIREDLGYLRVGTGRNTAHLYATVNVGGDIGTIDVDGTLYGKVTTNGNIRSLILDGSLGGQLDIDHDGLLEDVGSLTVFGSIASMRFNRSMDLVADVTVGGSISSLYLINASIRGDLTSRYGSFGSIRVTGGSILGKITASSIGTVMVTGGDIVGGGLEATAGNIRYVYVRGGTLDADLTAAGTIDILTLMGPLAAGRTISAGMGLKTVRITGDLAGTVYSARDITTLYVTGALTGAVNAEGVLQTLTVSGDLSGTVRAGAGIGRVTAGSVTDATIASGWNIGDVRVNGMLSNSFILAGYDTGADGLVGGGDDHPLTGSVHSGNIRSLSVRGSLDCSIVAAGVGPGPVGISLYMAFMSGGDNEVAEGTSSIGRVTLSGGYGPSLRRSGILADTEVDPRFAASVDSGRVKVDSGVTTVLSGSGTDFGPGVGNTKLVVGSLTLTLTGAGVANYDPATGALVLEATTSRSALRIANTGPAQTIRITGSDDSGLSSLILQGDVILDDVQIDGALRTLTVGALAPGASWQLPGGVTTARIGDPGNASIEAGDVLTWTMTGPFSGSLRADAIRRLTADAVSGALATRLGGADGITIRGAFSGSADIRGSVRTMTVGAMTGELDVSNGDLQSLRASSLGGVVNVQRGLARTVSVTAGDYTGSFRSLAGVSTFYVTRGAFTGLLSTGGDLTSLIVRSDFRGRVRSGGSIRRVALGSMTNGLVAASNNLDTVTITGHMYGSWLFAGFDPGDAGYLPGEVGNVAIGGSGAQADTPLGGDIRTVTIGGDMGRRFRAGFAEYAGSTISAAVGPGEDGYCGSADDQVRGRGTVGRVMVRGQIFGTGTSYQSFGIFAASNMPTVYHMGRQPFEAESNMTVGSMADAAGPSRILGLSMTVNSLIFRFSRPLDLGSVVLGDTLSMLMSTDAVFDPATDTDLTGYLSAPSWDAQQMTLTVRLSGYFWRQLVILGFGSYLEVSLDGTVAALDGDGAIVDRWGDAIDVEYRGAFPTGDGTPGGNFVYTAMLSDAADTFLAAASAGPLSVPVGGGTRVIGQSVDGPDDVDIFSFTGSIYDYIGITYLGSTYESALMCLFYRDTQGTVTTVDDSFEAVARYETTSQYEDSMTVAYELPASGEYYLAIAWETATAGSYQLSFTMSATDADLMEDMGGTLADVSQIGYFSNTVAEHRNLLGANPPKQLVYLNFTGGVATQGTYAPSTAVTAFELEEIDPTLFGRESEIINGGAGITGIVDNILSIFRNTPASYPGGTLTVERINLTSGADWAAYLAASSGLWFTTVDPAAARGLDPTSDFTTVFFGNAQISREDPGLLGLAGDIDLMNLSKADNAMVFTGNFLGYATGLTATERMNQFSRALANTGAHELGHVLGLNHQPTSGSPLLVGDDPDNNPATPDDSNHGHALMGYQSILVDTSELLELGTAPLTRNEFPVGSIDTVGLLMKWLA